MGSETNTGTEPTQTTLGDEANLDIDLSQEPHYTTSNGAAYLGDSLELIDQLQEGLQDDEDGLDLVVTSPPFALRREKEYGNESPEDYGDWFRQFADKVYDILDPSGSFVVDIGGGWQDGKPVRSLYQFELLTDLAGSDGPFHLAQDFYWHNPAKLPTPAQWVTIERIRVTDSVNHVWWLSKTERPKADNRRVLRDYSDAMETFVENGFDGDQRPSGHGLSGKFSDPTEDGSIPPNFLEIANTASNTHYLRACRMFNIDPHPARFPRQLPAFFIRLLTEPGDTVLDIFAGSNTTGAMAEQLGRKWLAFEQEVQYLHSSQLRFVTMADLDSSFKREAIVNGSFEAETEAGTAD
jgi:site-specific DNA-methyltransferase (cytosine-N4-specific)